MKCQGLFSEKNKNNLSKCRLLSFLPSMQSVKEEDIHRKLSVQYHLFDMTFCSKDIDKY